LSAGRRANTDLELERLAILFDGGGGAEARHCASRGSRLQSLGPFKTRERDQKIDESRASGLSQLDAGSSMLFSNLVCDKRVCWGCVGPIAESLSATRAIVSGRAAPWAGRTRVALPWQPAPYPSYGRLDASGMAVLWDM